MLSLLGFDEDSRSKLQHRYGLKAPNLSDEEVVEVYNYVRDTTQPVRGFSARTVYTHLLTQSIVSGMVNVVSVLLVTSAYRDKPFQWIQLAIKHRHRNVVMLLLAEGCAVSSDSLALYCIEEQHYIVLDLIVQHAMGRDPLALALLAAVESQVVQPVYILLGNPCAITSGVLLRAVELDNVLIVRALLDHPSCNVAHNNYAAVDASFAANTLITIELCSHYTYATRERHLRMAIRHSRLEVLKIILPTAEWSRDVVIEVLETQDDEMINAVILNYRRYYEELLDVICEYDSFPYLDRLCEYTTVDLTTALVKAAGHGAVRCLDLLLQEEVIIPPEVIRQQCRLLNEKIILMLIRDGRADMALDNNALLIAACRHSKYTIIEELLEYDGTDVNCRDSLLLRMAVEDGDIELVELLATSSKLHVSTDYERFLVNGKHEAVLQILRRYNHIIA